MIIFKQVAPLSSHLQQQKNQGRKIGFVPTMGALHQGHLALIETSRKENDLVVCSIFVNPTQFNNQNDFQNYPSTLENDIHQLALAGCSILFLPATGEIYPPDHLKKHYELGEIEHQLEGHYRPGHFQGVCQVVDRLLDIVDPHRLYLGQKDFQQCMVIQKLLQLTGRESSIAIKIVPTVREADGLAMSSRNLRLDARQRQLAAALYQELSGVRERLESTPLAQLKEEAINNLVKKGFEVDYFEIAEAGTLHSAKSKENKLVVLVAATVGEVRLIDNLPLN